MLAFALWQIGKGAFVGDALLQKWQYLISNSRDETVFHACRIHQLAALVGPNNQRLKPVGTRNVATDHKLLLAVRAVFDPSSRAPARLVQRVAPFAHDTFQSHRLHGRQDLLTRAFEKWRERQGIVRPREELRQLFSPLLQRESEDLNRPSSRGRRHKSGWEGSRKGCFAGFEKKASQQCQRRQSRRRWQTILAGPLEP